MIISCVRVDVNGPRRSRDRIPTNNNTRARAGQEIILCARGIDARALNPCAISEGSRRVLTVYAIRRVFYTLYTRIRSARNAHCGHAASRRPSSYLQPSATLCVRRHAHNIVCTTRALHETAQTTCVNDAGN